MVHLASGLLHLLLDQRNALLDAIKFTGDGDRTDPDATNDGDHGKQAANADASLESDSRPTIAVDYVSHDGTRETAARWRLGGEPSRDSLPPADGRLFAALAVISVHSEVSGGASGASAR